MGIRFLKEPSYKKRSKFYNKCAELLEDNEYCEHESISIIECDGDMVLECNNVECRTQWKDYEGKPQNDYGTDTTSTDTTNDGNAGR